MWRNDLLLKSSDEKYKITGAMLFMEFITCAINSVVEVLSGSFIFGMSKNFDFNKFWTTKLSISALSTTILVGMFWRRRRLSFLDAVSSLRVKSASEKAALRHVYNRILYVFVASCLIVDVTVGYCIMIEVPHFQTIAAGTCTLITLFAGIFFTYEYINFELLIKGMVQSSSNLMETRDSSAFKLLRDSSCSPVFHPACFCVSCRNTAWAFTYYACRVAWMVERTPPRESSPVFSKLRQSFREAQKKSLQSLFTSATQLRGQAQRI